VSGFVVKATAPDGEASWISPPSIGGFPGLGSREAANVFKSRLEAHAAINLLPPILERSGVKFAVEPVE
jgi:hypothetical protein